MEKFVDKNHFLVTKTDLKGVITYANKPFIEIVGGSGEKDLLYKPHSVVRHPEMPKIIFKLLWDNIKAQHEIFAYIKNKTFDGHFYWVFANVTASVDELHNSIGYYSVRRAPNRKALEVIIPLYTSLLSAEKTQGIQASYNALQQVLSKQGCDYHQWVNQLQRL
ncbi:PAS domain-containing protein [Helicobacter suis]|uniref:PAS domain-containing protein n=1 Tax=Helicobacter suis TaxID=104628 RepID=UPI0013D16C7A|nr:PAS domain-containing protein [Helicobacter suis]